jgi:hypothetical protein
VSDDFGWLMACFLLKAPLSESAEKLCNAVGKVIISSGSDQVSKAQYALELVQDNPSLRSQVSAYFTNLGIFTNDGES